MTSWARCARSATCDPLFIKLAARTSHSMLNVTNRGVASRSWNLWLLWIFLLFEGYFLGKLRTFQTSCQRWGFSMLSLNGELQGQSPKWLWSSCRWLTSSTYLSTSSTLALHQFLAVMTTSSSWPSPSLEWYSFIHHASRIVQYQAASLIIDHASISIILCVSSIVYSQSQVNHQPSVFSHES